jgi:hypothetical protein
MNQTKRNHLNTFKSFFILSAALSAIHSSAATKKIYGGSGTRGGADIVACPPAGSLVDLAETGVNLSQLDGLRLNFFDAIEESDFTLDTERKESFSDIVQLFHDRLAKKDPRRASNYLLQVLTLHREIERLTSDPSATSPIIELTGPGEVLPNLDDEEAIGEKRTCKRLQSIIQTVDIEKKTTTFRIQREFLGGRISTAEYALKLFHEVIYNERILNGARTSKITRQFTRLLGSRSRSDAQNLNQYASFLKSGNFSPEFYIFGWLDTRGLAFDGHEFVTLQKLETGGSVRIPTRLSLQSQATIEVAAIRIEKDDVTLESLKFYRTPFLLYLDNDGYLREDLKTGTPVLLDLMVQPEGFSAKGPMEQISNRSPTYFFDTHGKLKNIVGSGFRNRPLLLSTRGFLERLFACLKRNRVEDPIWKRQTLARLTEAREAVRTDNDQTLSQIVSECENDKDKFIESYTIPTQAEAALKHLLHPQVIECKGRLKSLTVATILGVFLRDEKVNCTWSDGTVGVYRNRRPSIVPTVLGATYTDITIEETSFSPALFSSDHKWNASFRDTNYYRKVNFTYTMANAKVVLGFRKKTESQKSIYEDLPVVNHLTTLDYGLALVEDGEPFSSGSKLRQKGSLTEDTHFEALIALLTNLLPEKSDQ